MKASECIATEAELQRHCGSLHITHALESSCGLFLFIFFSAVAVKLHARGHLRSPAVACLRFICWHTYEFCEEFVTTLNTVGQMHEMDLEVRLRFCGNVDKMTNAASAILSALGITRWLSIGNVNGMRYIGYAMTCPFTQLELAVLIAPIIPCYRFAATFTFGVTLFCLTLAYVASLFWMPVWEGDLLLFLATGSLDDLAPTVKLYVVLPALCGISVLWFIVLPYFVLTYTRKGGGRNPDLPQEYRFLVALVWCTWICFPCWWFLSWEGNSVIEDTKFNEVGFMVLNMIAKGMFTWQSFRVGELYEVRRKREEDGKTLRPSWSSCALKSRQGKPVPPIISRASSRKLSASKFVQVLRAYDEDSEEDEEEESESEEGEEPAEDKLKSAAMGHPGDRVHAPSDHVIQGRC